MFCPQCGKENESGARFCGHCGATIGDGAQVSRPTPEPAAEPLRIVTPGAAGGVVSPGLKWGVLALSVLPSNLRPDTIPGYNEALRDLCAVRTNTFYVDVFALMSTNGHMRADLLSDETHPNAAGMQLMIRELERGH